MNSQHPLINDQNIVQKSDHSIEISNNTNEINSFDATKQRKTKKNKEDSSHYYLNFKPSKYLSEECTCPICFYLLMDPVSLTCGHNLCFECLESSKRIAQKNDQTHKCPLCRQSIDGQAKPNLPLKNIMINFGGRKYKYEIKKKLNFDNQTKIFETYLISKRYKILIKTIKTYFTENPVITYDELISKLISNPCNYSINEIRYVLSKLHRDIFIVHESNLICTKHIANYLNENYNIISPEDTIRFLLLTTKFSSDNIINKYPNKSPIYLKLVKISHATLYKISLEFDQIHNNINKDKEAKEPAKEEKEEEKEAEKEETEDDEEEYLYESEYESE